MADHKIVIARHRPGFRAAMIGAAAFLLAISAYGLYRYTRLTTVSDFERAQTELEQLRDERRNLAHQLREARGEISELKDQLVYVKSSTEIDNQSCETVRNSLSGLQAEASDLREQLAFYRGIVSPELSRAGVRVYDFKVSPGKTAGMFHYELVLIQSVRHDRRIGGRAQLVIEGIKDGVKQSLKLDDLALGDSKDVAFSFKYFEEFGGDFHLPEGFNPAVMRVTLTTDAEGAPEVKQEFEWKKAFRA